MMGITNKRFLERTGREFDAVQAIEEAVSLHDFEKAVVRRFGSFLETGEQKSAIAYMAMAMRLGHLCVRTHGSLLRPDPASLLRGSETEEQIARWRKAIHVGLSALPASLLGEQGPIVQVDYPDQRVGFYFRRNWSLEQRLYQLLSEMDVTTPGVVFDEKSSEKILKEYAEKLLPEQLNAIKKALLRRLTVVTGGPGTGKSYTAAKFLELYCALSKESAPVVALAAPTGKAAANLQEKIGGFDTEARTLHSLLEIGRTGRRKYNATQLEADVVIIDECSMIDAPLMCQLLEAVKPQARLILLGDNDQLPPVEVGSLFADMVDMLSERNSLATCRLKTCVRAELKGIVDLAEVVNSGKADALFTLLQEGREGVKWEELEDHEALNRCVQEVCVDFSQLPSSPDAVAAYFSKKRLLAPLRKGIAGLENLNVLLAKNHYQVVRRRGDASWIAPIIATANDYRLGVYNGESGLLVRPVEAGKFSPLPQETDTILLCDRSGGWRALPAALLPHLELAYCLSVHKSQGSEFGEVLLLLPSSAASFGKEVVYTGITRAKKKLKLFSQKETLQKALSISSRRISGLARTKTVHVD